MTFPDTSTLSHKLTFPVLPYKFRKPASFLLLAFLIFLLFPHYFYQPVRGGLDPSYDIALNLAWKYHLTFGKDIVFTFGPLGILNSRFPVGVSRWVYLLLDTYYLVTLFLILASIFKKQAGFFTALFLLLGFTVEMYDSAFQRYFLFFLFYIAAFVKEPRRWMSLIQAALLSILSFYYKVNLGMTAIVIFFMAISYLMILKKISIKNYALTLIFYCCAILLLAWMLNVSLKGYVVGSLHLIDAYNDAMFLPGDLPYLNLLPTAVFILLLIAALSVVLPGFALYKKELLKYLDEIFIYGVVLLTSFVLFKSGFVRFDAYHPFVFFRIIGLVAGLLYLFSPLPFRKVAAVCAWAVLIRSFVSMQMLTGLPGLAPLKLLSTRIDETGHYFKELKSYQEDMGAPGTDSRRRAAADGRPAANENELKRIIGDHSVDIIPFEISRIYANGLRYDPRPVIQSYSAYDRYLDSLNYEKYMSPDAPDYILFSLKSIDDRYPFFDESKTKLAIFSRYTIDREIDGELLLKKKELSSPGLVPPGLLLPSGEETRVGRMGEDLPVNQQPESHQNDLQYSKIFVRYTPLSRIGRLLYHPPALKITLTLENGEKLAYRAIPPMLEDGVILNKYIGNLRDFQLLMQSGGRLGCPVKTFRIEEGAVNGDAGSGGFASGIKIVTTYYAFPTRPEPERVADSLGLAQLTREIGQYKPFATDSSAYLPDSFRCWVDKEESYSPLIEIEGWAYREKGSNKNTVVKAVLRSGNALYELPSEKQDRWDISTYYKRTDTVVGFRARVGKSQLPPGKYQIGIAMIDTLLQKKSIRYTDRIVVNE